MKLTQVMSEIDHYPTKLGSNMVIKWQHFPRYWPCVRGIHRSSVNSPHKGQWRGALMFSLICTWINGWVNNGEAGDLRRHQAHYDVTVKKHVNGSFFRVMEAHSWFSELSEGKFRIVLVVRCHTLTRTYPGTISIRPIGTNFVENSINSQ